MWMTVDERRFTITLTITQLHVRSPLNCYWTLDMPNSTVMKNTPSCQRGCPRV
jgi:hypothetical protein